MGAVRLALVSRAGCERCDQRKKSGFAAPVPPLHTPRTVLGLCFVCIIFLLGAQSCKRHDGVDCFLVVEGERLVFFTFDPLARVRFMYLRVDAGSKSAEFSAPLLCSCVCVCVRMPCLRFLLCRFWSPTWVGAVLFSILDFIAWDWARSGLTVF